MVSNIFLFYVMLCVVLQANCLGSESCDRRGTSEAIKIEEASVVNDRGEKKSQGS